jgi:N-acetylgalactosamine kinase
MTDGSRILRYITLSRRFEDIYGEEPLRLVRVPARINIIGEHIDYVDYFKTAVLPFGSAEHDMVMAFRPRTDGLVRASTLAAGFEPKEFCIGGFRPSLESDSEDRWVDYLSDVGPPVPSWDNYVKSSVFYLQNLNPHINLSGMELLVDSEIPVAGGASSSSALVVTAAMGTRLVNGFDLDLDELAESCSRAEWFIGTRGGKMDHAAMCFSRSSNALLLTFDPFSVEMVPMPTGGYRWVTFFTRPAEKGSLVLSEYNERSIVSKYFIPCLIRESLAASAPLAEEWSEALDAIDRRDACRLARRLPSVEAVLGLLPDHMTMRRFCASFGEMTDEVLGLYPVLLDVKGLDHPLAVRDRAKHHLGEISRVIQAVDVLHEAHRLHLDNDSVAEEVEMRKLGRLLTETHASLRDLYGVSTDDLEEVVDAALDVDGVLGARVMGGGFGGNVLVLVKSEAVASLVDSVRLRYYAPHGRTALSDQSIMVSTPGEGASVISTAEMRRMQLAALVNDWRGWEENQHRIKVAAAEILGGEAEDPELVRPVSAVIIAAGKGRRATESGLGVAKPLAPINGEPTIRCVVRKLKSLSFAVERIVVVVSPANEEAIREALTDHKVIYAMQHSPLGTADAVLCAEEALGGFEGDIIVMWSTQPVVRRRTVRSTVVLHQALGCSTMSFPTAKRANPYAPIMRDEAGWVIDSVETHLEGAEPIRYGEDNVGVFVLPRSVLFRTLHELRRLHYLPDREEYDTPHGELGFPNLMVRTLAETGNLVFAFAMADPRETKGIKVAGDSSVAQRYISELCAEDRSARERVERVIDDSAGGDDVGA